MLYLDYGNCRAPLQKVVIDASFVAYTCTRSSSQWIQMKYTNTGMFMNKKVTPNIKCLMDPYEVYKYEYVNE